MEDEVEASPAISTPANPRKLADWLHKLGLLPGAHLKSVTHKEMSLILSAQERMRLDMPWRVLDSCSQL